jgi:hypothetical protein
MKHTYNNWSYKIFEGFYESHLYNSDSLYYLEQSDKEEGYLQANESYDIDWESFTNSVAQQVTYNLYNALPNNDIIQEINFKALYSPRYYNYETDSLILELNLNLTRLKTYCFTTHKKDFNQYLKDNFTSYDGFISFIPNNLIDFKGLYSKNNTKLVNTLIEYYLLSCIYESNNPDDFEGFDTSYHYSNYESANEELYFNLIKVTETEVA